MGLRKQKRQIAKARMIALGLGNVNKKLSYTKDGVANWRRALTDERAIKAQLSHGIKSRRKIKKVSA